MGNLQNLFQLGQQMQARMSDLQRKLENETISVTSGGGMIEVTADFSLLCVKWHSQILLQPLI